MRAESRYGYIVIDFFDDDDVVVADVHAVFDGADLQVALPCELFLSFDFEFCLGEGCCTLLMASSWTVDYLVVLKPSITSSAILMNLTTSSLMG